jgi:hypothetical protein
MILQLEGTYFRGNQAKDIPTDISRRQADAGCKHVKPTRLSENPISIPG